MTSYTSGSAVKSGYYLRARTLSVALVANEGDRLPGPAGARYVRVPWPVVLVLAPVLSIAFLVLLPVLALGVMAYGVARRLSLVGRRASAELAATVSPGWRAGEAHLGGKPGEEHAPDAGGTKAPAELERLERDIAERRDRRPPE